MKRYATRLLAAYAVAMTLVVAWLGCLEYICWRLLAEVLSKFPADYRQILANYDASRHFKAPLDRTAMLFGSLEPANLAAAVFGIVLAFLARGPRLLAAYAGAMTLVVAWLGCRAYVYGRLLGVHSKNSAADQAQIIANWGAPSHLTAPLDGPALLFAHMEPANLAAAVFVIFLAFLAFGPKGRTPVRTDSLPEERPACPS